MTYEKIVSTVKKSLAKADASKVKTTVAVQVDIVGEGEGAFYVKVDDGTLAIEPYEYYDHDAKLIVSAKDCVDLFGGKLDVVKAYEEGKIKAEGDVEKLLSLKEMLPAAKKAAPAKKPAAKKAAPAKKAAKPAAKAPAKKAEPAKAAKAPAKKAEPVKAEAKAAEKKTEVKAVEKKTAAKPAVKKAEPAKAPAKKAVPAKKPAKTTK